MKFYLIYPKFSSITYASFDYTAKMMLRKANNPPLGLLTMAGMIPHEHEIIFCDEAVSEIDWKIDCDYVCLSGMHLQKKRMRDIAIRFRERGIKVIIGGPSVMSIPEEYRDCADILIVGEAERIWPQCLNDIKEGCARDTYTEKEFVDMALSPIPRFDLIRPGDYITASIQTTRGCPFRCEFCDIITLYGRKPRTKPIANVVREVETIVKLGSDQIFIVDDNLIGDPRYAMALCTELAKLQKKLPRRFYFTCQGTINLAKNIPLLMMLREAGCGRIFIGVETPRTASLNETLKTQNSRTDMLEDIKTIQSHGIIVQIGIIVGFDSDDVDVFQEQLNFSRDVMVPMVLPNKLGALPGTPLYERVKREGRLRSDDFVLNIFSTNIDPTCMSLTELNVGFVSMCEHLYTPDAYSKRCLGEMARLQCTPTRYSNYPIPLLYLALGWVLLCYLLDKNRMKLIEFFIRLVPVALFRNPMSVELVVQRLATYIHACHVISEVSAGCQAETEYNEKNPFIRRIPEYDQVQPVVEIVKISDQKLNSINHVS